MSINSTASLNAMLQMNLLKATTSMNMSALRMSTGLKINSMADGAVSYITASNIQQSIRGWQGVQESTQKGISLLNTTKNSLSGMKSILNQLNGLADTASSSTLGAERRAELQKQADLLLQQLYNKKDTSRFDGIKIFGDETNSNTIGAGGGVTTSTAQVIGTTTTVGVTTTNVVKEVVSGLINQVDQKGIKELEAAGYTVITSAADFKTKIEADPSGKFALFGNLDFTGVDHTAIEGFSGELNGNGFAIKNLTVNSPSNIDQGLFGTLGDNSVVKNLMIENAQIEGLSIIGALASQTGNNVTIDNVAVIGGTISGAEWFVGGLIGGLSYNSTIKNSYSTAIVNGNAWSGGLAGAVDENSTIQNSYATGNVYIKSGMGGGLAGANFGTISGSWASGAVTGSANVQMLGGLVGENGSTITNSYATGKVTAGKDSTGISYAGGLVGKSTGSASAISNSYATGAVTGTGSHVGGLVGETDSTIANSYATGTITAGTNSDGYSYAGGLVGYSNNTITNSYATGNVTASGSIVGGFIGYGEKLITNSYATGSVTIARPTLVFEPQAPRTMASRGLAGQTGNTGMENNLANESIDTTMRPGLTTEVIDKTLSPDFTTQVTMRPELTTGPIPTTKPDWTTLPEFTTEIDKTTIVSAVSTFADNVGGFGGIASAQNSYSTGDVNANNNEGKNIGGFVGTNQSNINITNSYATGDVNAKNSDNVGGLVGEINNIEVSNSYSTGAVSGYSFVGGFAGQSNGTITNSYAQGSVSNMLGTSGNLLRVKQSLGGFVGYTNSKITGSWSSGTVASALNNNSSDVGGFVGIADDGATISNSYTKGLVANGGGFAGSVTSEATIISAYYNKANIRGVIAGDSNGIKGLSAASLDSINTRTVNNDLYNPTVQKVSSDITTGATTIAITSVTQFLSVVGSSTAGKTLVLMTDLDFNGVSFNEITSFSGTLDGNGHTIKNISTGKSLFTEITSTGTVKDSVLENITVYGSNQGTLAGTNNGIITNVTAKNITVGFNDRHAYALGGLVGTNNGTIAMSQVKGGQISAHQNSGNIGGLAGINNGTIEKSSSNINMQITNSLTDNIGGLVGYNKGNIQSSTTNGLLTIDQGENIGGLVGENYGGLIENATSNMEIRVSGRAEDVGGLIGESSGGIIERSSSFGKVLASNSKYVGGLIGYVSSSSTVRNSSVTGEVVGSDYVGGLIGLLGISTVTNNYSGSSTVTGTNYVGGLVGRATSGEISNSYSSMTIVGVNYAGGFAGALQGVTNVNNSYATGAVTGTNRVGGFVGEHTDSSSITKSYSTGSVSAQTYGGGFAGVVSGSSSITSSFWNKETSGMILGHGQNADTGTISLTGLTSAQFSSGTSFVNAGWGSEWVFGGTNPQFRNFTAGSTLPSEPPRWVPPVAEGSIANNAGLSSPITSLTGSTVVVSTTQKTFSTTATTTVEKVTTTEVVTTTGTTSKPVYVKNANQYTSIYTSYSEGQSLATSIDTGMTFGKIYFDLSNENNAESSKAVIESLISKVNEKERTMNNYLDSLNYSAQFQKTSIQGLNEQYDNTVKADMTEEKINYTKKQIVLDNISSIMAQTARMRYSPIMTLLGAWK